MFNRKTCKQTARKNLARHYLFFVCLCLLAAMVSADYADSYNGATIRLNRVLYPAENGGIIMDDQLRLDTVISNALFNQESDFGKIAEELLIKASDKVSTMIGTHIEIGHTKGVFAGITNQLMSGSFLLTMLSVLYSLLGSVQAAAILLVILAVAFVAAVWVFFVDVFKVVYCRIFMEGRLYKKVPLQRLSFLFSVKKWIRASLTMLVKAVYLSLWSLTVIGGFIKSYSYFAVPYIVAENPAITGNKAVTLSRRMMNGHKWECFKLSLSFIGWFFLDIITFGLSGIFYSNPYKEAVMCEYFAYLRQQAIDNKIEGIDALTDKYLYETASTEAIEEGYGTLESYPIPTPAPIQGVWNHILDFFGIYFTESQDRDYKREQCQIIQYENVKDVYDHNLYPAALSPIPSEKRSSRMAHSFYTRRYSIWTLIVMFFLFSFIGWIWEVSLHLVMDGSFVNRGVFHGPWLPIYGSGGVCALMLLNKLRKKPILEFLSAVVMCGIIEYTIGWYLELTHGGQKWWSYEGYFLNIDGRVCAEGLLVFGLGCIVAVYFIGPILDDLVQKLPRKAVIIFCVIFLLLFTADKIYSSAHPNTGKGITDYESYVQPNTEDTNMVYRMIVDDTDDYNSM